MDGLSAQGQSAQVVGHIGDLKFTSSSFREAAGQHVGVGGILPRDEEGGFGWRSRVGRGVLMDDLVGSGQEDFGHTFVGAHGAAVVENLVALLLHAGKIQLPLGARVSTMRGGAAQLQLSTGTQLHLGSDADLHLARSVKDQRFVLSSGSVQANVHKVHAGQRFVVATPDTEIEVIGTAFQLSVLHSAQACGDGLRTRLVVTEGTVDVHADSRLWRVERGQHWPADCPLETKTVEANAVESPPEPAAAATSADDASPSGLQKQALRPATRRGAQSRVDTLSVHSTARSSVQEQSDLFARAAAAGREGSANQALQLYSELLSRFPGSALAESAVVSRMRLLAGSRPDAARTEARHYLNRYPRGFASREARRLLGDP